LASSAPSSLGRRAVLGAALLAGIVTAADESSADVLRVAGSLPPMSWPMLGALLGVVVGLALGLMPVCSVGPGLE
jgi:hypothetical protein